MNNSDMKIVHECIDKFGDSFWKDFDEVEGLVSNKYLFDDIIKYVNKAGYDLQLIKLENNK